jgi:hypothetical protein
MPALFSKRLLRLPSYSDLFRACHEAAHATTALAVGGNVGLLALSYDDDGILHGEFRENFDANKTK